MTQAKEELIGLSQDSPQRFLDELYGDDIPGLKPMPALSKEWYEVYKAWCAREGLPRPAPSPKFINALVRKRQITHSGQSAEALPDRAERERASRLPDARQLHRARRQDRGGMAG